MKPYLKKYHQEYNSSDIKPKGKISRWINKAERQKTKRAIQEEVKNPPECEESSISDEIMAIQYLI
jgi:hypothetical protein